MNQEDKSEFASILRLTFKIKGQIRELDDETIKFYWNVFKGFSLPAFRSAMERAATETQGRLEPAKIRQFLPCPLGHPTPEEAWNFAPKSESDSGYVTDQIMAALAAAQSSIDQGNLIAARMAFIESYKKAVDLAKLRGESARFWYSGSVGLTYDQAEAQRLKHQETAYTRGWIAHKEQARIAGPIPTNIAEKIQQLRLAMDKSTDRGTDEKAKEDKREQGAGKTGAPASAPGET